MGRTPAGSIRSETRSSTIHADFGATSQERRRLVERKCCQLRDKLGLQNDSADNQAEHVLALWESVFTRHPGKPEDALWDLWQQLLRSTREWADKVWRPLTGDVERDDDEPLTQVCLYLLIWGELGNIRYCPEILCFLFTAARTHCHSIGRTSEEMKCKSAGAFLTEILKPMFDAMVSETYDQRDEFPQHRFKYGRAPAPAKASNYDDWNEFFWDSSRLRSSLRLKSSKRNQPRLFDAKLSPAAVWGRLPDVDWYATLHGRKSHYEVHSLLPMLVGCYRIFLLQTLAFAVLLLWAATRPRWGTRLQQAGLGLVAPAWMIIYEVGYQSLTPGLSVMSRMVGVFKLLFIYCMPCATFTLVVFAHQNLMPDFDLPFKVKMMDGRLLDSAMVTHLTISSLVMILALLPQGQNRYQWRFYPVIRWHRMLFGILFWLVVLATTYSMNYAVLDLCGKAINGVWALYGRELQETWHKNALLVVQLVLLVFPTFLCFFSCLPLLTTLFIAFVGAFRGIRRLGGIRLMWYRRGVGMTKMPQNVCARVLQIPREENPRSRTLISKAFKWWNHLSDRELKGFVHFWNRAVEELRRVDLISDREKDKLVFEAAYSARLGHVPRLLDPMDVFRLRNSLPSNREARRRLVTLARSAQMQPLPKATVNQMPTFTVLIPHYSETILFRPSELFDEGKTTDLLHYLVKYYRSEFSNFAERALIGNGLNPSLLSGLDAAGRDFSYLPSTQMRELEVKLQKWTSARMQTLWRTVDGVCNAYANALQELAQVQDVGLSEEESRNLVKSKFQVVLAMQQYAQFADPSSPSYDVHQVAGVEAILSLFGDWVSVAYIEESKGDTVMEKRYFSCLFDWTCPLVFPDGRPLVTAESRTVTGMRKPKYRIELPGYPILGHGKSDNQNCSLIFTRGEVLQMIDANQDAYFESAVFLPLALQEMVGADGPKRRGRRPGIIGFREHIFSNVGLLGRLAADSEFTFGTVIQRTMDWPLDARLHYGHPDMMDKLQMLQQGGVSKGTKGLNLSEDVFAGLDLVLRGGWTDYKEYFHVGKGRDMGFMSVLSFHAKVSMGNGEQIITRQWMRLGLELPLSRLLGIFYTHIGFYFNQLAMTHALQTFAFVTAFFSMCAPVNLSFVDAAVGVTTSYFGLFYLLFVLASVIPLLLEVTIEEGLRAALRSVSNSLLSLSPVFSAFQSKLVAYYFRSTVSYGGAQYIPTGRGLATTRETFLKLFRTFTHSHWHDAFEMAFLFLFTSRIFFGWGFYICIWFSVVSWVFAPFLFNPRQFDNSNLAFKDFLEFTAWLWKPFGEKRDSWVVWDDQHQDVRRASSSLWMAVPSVRFLALICTTALMLNLAPPMDFSLTIGWFQWLLALLPPVAFLVFCILVASFTVCLSENVSPIPFHALMSLLCVAVSCFEMSVLNWWSETILVVLLHKYVALRWLMEACDDVAVHRIGGCSCAFLQNACRWWARSWRFVRDTIIGLFLCSLCILCSFIPCLAPVHDLFLFRTRSPKCPDTPSLDSDTDSTSDEEKPSAGGASMLHLLERFAPKRSKIQEP